MLLLSDTRHSFLLYLHVLLYSKLVVVFFFSVSRNRIFNPFLSLKVRSVQLLLWKFPLLTIQHPVFLTFFINISQLHDTEVVEFYRRLWHCSCAKQAKGESNPEWRCLPQGYGFKLREGEFRVDIRKKFSPVRMVVSCWHRWAVNKYEVICRETYVWLVGPCFLTEKMRKKFGNARRWTGLSARAPCGRGAVLRAARGRCGGGRSRSRRARPGLRGRRGGGDGAASGLRGLGGLGGRGRPSAAPQVSAGTAATAKPLPSAGSLGRCEPAPRNHWEGEVGGSCAPIAGRRWSRAGGVGDVGKGGSDSLEFSTPHMHLHCSEGLSVRWVTLTKQCFPCITYNFIYNIFIMGSK